MLGASWSNEALWTCLVLLIVILIWINLAVAYYFIRVARYSIKRKRNKRSSIFKDKKRRVIDIDELSLFITHLATSLSKMSANKVGSLIVFENRDNLERYIQLGNKMDSPFFPEFIYSIFYNHESALHDGAMIIRDFRIASLSSYLPLTKRLLPIKFGSRHRAAFGITERYDALAFVVSESTGNISFMKGPDHIILSSDTLTLAKQLVDIFFSHYHQLSNNNNKEVIEKIKERLN